MLGSWIVKVEPRPSSLATVMSPPIIWQKRLLIASPRPVPPHLRVVEARPLSPEERLKQLTRNFRCRERCI